MAFVLIQHLDPKHPSLLREALARATEMVVSLAVDGAPVEPNHVYVIPPAADISLRHGLLTVAPTTPDTPRPHLPIDFFLRSLAAERGSQAIGVVLSGTASDGTEGLRAIKAEDGITLAQEPRSAKFGEMPRSAMDAGVVDYLLAIPELAEELMRLSRHPYMAARETAPSTGDAALLNQILMVVRNGVGVDFTEYKRPTFERRLARRMALRHAEGLPGYLALLQGDPAEVRSLYEDILIHVTSFFRDREVFEALESEILPAILAHKPAGAPIRLWVAGCSTGEEVYSLGISLSELAGATSHPIQIFGSDLSEPIIAKARAGVYPDAALREVSDERRRRHFVKTDRGYRIGKAIRELCVFVQHDLARDPPFSKLDLVSCRNVLIYFDQALQRRIIPSFHYSLNQPGYLLLGRTESVGGFGQLFSEVDKTNKIFARSAAPSALRFAPRLPARPARSAVVVDHDATPAQAPSTAELVKDLDRMLLAQYAPPGILINEKMEILHFRGQTGAFLQAASGVPQSDVMKMARHGLFSALRSTIAEVKRDKVPVRRNGVEVDQDGFTRTCNLVVMPFAGPPGREGLYVVLFEDVAPPDTERSGPASGRRRRSAETSQSRHVPKVEEELIATREYLQSLLEERGRTNDDLGTANEELVTGNEELQSINEELETAKEELQSSNEELTTVNDELHSRNQEVTQVNSDLLNLLATVDIPIIILDRERRIRRFTPKARSIFAVLPSDTGRHIDDIASNLDVVDLDRRIAEVIDTSSMKESEVQDREGHWHRMQIRPYKTTDNKIDGAILSLVDIDALKHHVSEAQDARSEAERSNGSKDLFLAILGHELRTPLSSLLLQSQMLRRGGTMSPARIIRAGEIMERGTRMQMQLVDDLLDVSRIVAGKMRVELRLVDLCAVIRVAIEGVSEAAEKKSIKLVPILDDRIGVIAGDPTRLQQVVSNLLTNAIKFTPDGGQVDVTLDAADGCARIKVSDTGTGIEPGFLPRVFNRFSQEDSSDTRMHGGLGLGLAIVRHLVEQHGGSVRADSPGIGRGATFSVMLPLLRVDLGPDVVEAGAVSVIAAGLTGVKGDGDYRRIKDLRVLVVDDDPPTREAVAEMLKGLGAEVRVAESGAAALLAVGEFKPMVLLCDIAMPGEDGYTFIRRMRDLGVEGGGDIPALALTALAAEDDHRRALSAGFQMHLTKPVDIERLCEAVVELAMRRPAPPSRHLPDHQART